MKTATPMMILLVLLAGCSAQAPAPEKQVQESLNQTIDCSNPAADI